MYLLDPPPFADVETETELACDLSLETVREGKRRKEQADEFCWGV